jgi:hypothetical protein
MNKSDKLFFRNAVKQYYPDKYKQLYPDDVTTKCVEVKRKKQNMSTETKTSELRKQVLEKGIGYSAAMTREECVAALDLHLRSDQEGINQLVKTVKDRYVAMRKEQKELKKRNEPDRTV